MSFSGSEHEESFYNFHVYLHNLRRTNPHTDAHIKTDLMDRFQCCFLAIGWVVYFVRLRGNYLKTMYVAVAKNGNNLTFPIAFGMVVENNMFLMWLKECLGQGKEVAFISNMDDIVSSHIDNVFTDSYHGYTYKSVHKYLRTRVGSGRSVETLYWRTLKSYTMSIFKQNFSRLSRDAREVLTNIGHPKWARSYFLIIRWNVLDMEVPQYFSELSLNQRNVPIITLIEGICAYMQNTFFERSILADLNTHTCSCGKWHSLGIPCGQAIAIARHSNMHELLDMVQVYYGADVFQLIYQTQIIHPLPPPS
uniref:Zinc finger PMZ-type domain-containing protein n=1 Tax=Lactuca sativa TaxID=4236 RepID=A0A9R1WCN5_LACSA|nr:hypothetical protein LSAT_V11C200056380 [Lactuca sativa]